ncbi:hypothetical protein JCM16161A_12730 [Vulcanisaeta sp. JCM 16161]
MHINYLVTNYEWETTWWGSTAKAGAQAWGTRNKRFIEYEFITIKDNEVCAKHGRA